MRINHSFMKFSVDENHLCSFFSINTRQITIMKSNRIRTKRPALTVPRLAAALLIISAALQIGCGTVPMTPPPVAEAAGAYQPDAARAPAQQERPGLGNSWGERRESRVESTHFVRASKSRPLAVSKLFYNDDPGAKAMLAGRSFRKRSGALGMDGGLVSIGLQDASGRYLPSYQSGNDRIFVGKPGRRYTIVAEI